MGKKSREYILIILSFFLLRIPNFYLIPGVSSSVLTTQGIARVLVLAASLVIFVKKRFVFKLKNEEVLVLALFILQTMSIFGAFNIEAYLLRYKDILISLLLYLVIDKIEVDNSFLMRVLITSSIINVVYSLLVIYVPFSRDLLRIISYDRYYDLVLSDIARGRYYSTSYDEAILPFFIWSGNIILAVLVIFITFISNFRTKILVAAISVLVTFLLMMKNKFKVEKMYVLLVGICVVMASALFLGIGKESYFDRFNINDEAQTETINSRKSQIERGFSLANAPFGVGLGNYYDYIPSNMKKNRDAVDRTNSVQLFEVNDAIHNNFASVAAESGYAAFVVYLLMILTFLKNDAQVLFTSKVRTRSLLIMSFWGLFIYGFFNPGTALSYQFQFWFFRGLLKNENID